MKAKTKSKRQKKLHSQRLTQTGLGNRSKELAKQLNSSQRLKDLNDTNIAPCCLKERHPKPRNYNLPSKNLCDPNKWRIGSVLIPPEGNALKCQRFC